MVVFQRRVRDRRRDSRGLDRRPWSASLQARVFDPLGMTDSSPVFTPEALAAAAVGYQWRDNDRPGSLHPRAGRVAGVGLRRSGRLGALDARGHGALHAPVSQRRKDRRRPAVDVAGGVCLDDDADRSANGKPAGSADAELTEAPEFYRQYGFGLSVFDSNGDRLIGHTGGMSGYTACMQMNLTRGFGVDRDGKSRGGAAASLRDRALRDARAARAKRRRAAASPPPAPDPAHVADAADYAGTYAAPAGTFTVAAEGDRLILTTERLAITLYPRGDDQFWADDPNFSTYLIAFGRDASKARRRNDVRFAVVSEPALYRAAYVPAPGGMGRVGRTVRKRVLGSAVRDAAW